MPTIVTTVRATETARRNKNHSIHIAAILALVCLDFCIGVRVAFAGTVMQNNMRAAITDLPTVPFFESPDTADIRFIESFYANREYQPAWLNQDQLADLRKLGTVAQSHGLAGNTGFIPALSRQLKQAQSSVGFQTWAQLDVLATLTIAQLICDLRFGYLDPTLPAATNVDASRRASRCGFEFVQQAARADSLIDYLNSLTPDSPLYRRLKLSLAEHQRMTTVTPLRRVPPGRPLQVGMTSDRVPALRERLRIWPTVTDSLQFRRYDDTLATAVRNFQQQHRLEADGVLGKQTVTALNISTQERIEQLRVNMEWQRWALSDQQRSYLLVNIAHYITYLVHDGEVVWSGRIQVGRSDRPTI